MVRNFIETDKGTVGEINCPALQGDEPRSGGGGLTPTGTTPDASTDNINGSEKGEKSLLCMGNPSGPAGHLPYKAEEFCLRTDKPLLD